MIRRAILIEASEAHRQHRLPGAALDPAQLQKWLLSNAGGAWHSQEITILANTSPGTIRQAIAETGGADFTFMSFSGHGRIVKNPQGQLTQMITAGNGDEMPWTSLKPKSKRSVMACDACRIVETKPMLSESIKAAAATEQRSASLVRERCRLAYDQAIITANEGTFWLYGCQVNQFCREDPMNGGYFTTSLIREGAFWFDSQRSPGVLNISDALSLASNRVQQMAVDQIPNGGPECRSGNCFPFAVRA